MKKLKMLTELALNLLDTVCVVVVAVLSLVSVVAMRLVKWLL